MTQERTAWLSAGIEQLIAESARRPAPPDSDVFDVLIVGSGYGGAMAAAHLSDHGKKRGIGLRIAVLERGQEYLPGMFPGSLSTLAGHVRVTTPLANSAKGNRDGLFDIRVNKDINALVANGLGGGSLINAGVMETPPRGTFDERWPKILRRRIELDDHFDACRRELGAKRKDTDNTIRRHPEFHKNPIQKYQSLQALNKGAELGEFRDAAITVAMQDGPNNSQVEMKQCKLCGDCATGCNFGAKESLDLNLLVRACRNGVKLFTGATVLSLAHTGNKDTWTVRFVHTLPQLAQREIKDSKILARRVILAAGTFGSTEILLRSRTEGLTFSGQLGKQLSGNGDTIAVGYNQKRPANAVADESSSYAERKIGPTITGIIDRRCKGNPHPVIIEEMAVPGAMRRLFEELYTTANCLYELADHDSTSHSPVNPVPDPFAINPDRILHTSVYAVMGDDGAGGTIELREPFEKDSDTALTVNWEGLREHPLFPSQVSQLETLVSSSGSGGKILANPGWRLLPEPMEFLLGSHKGPQLTVHPLGGCAMGDDSSNGVVDDLGRVFTGNAANPEQVHEGLVVLDGSIIPCALGTNPALTIAAVASRALAGLIDNWTWTAPAEPELEKALPVNPYEQRPVFKEIVDPAPLAATKMEFVERLRGPVKLEIEGTPGKYMAEVTLFFQKTRLSDLIASDDLRAVKVDTKCAAETDPCKSKHCLHVAKPNCRDPSFKNSQLRLFRWDDWEKIKQRHLSGRQLESALAGASIFTAPLTGTLRIMARGPSTRCQRVTRVALAYLKNRGLRDIWQLLFPLPHERQERAAQRKRAGTVSLWQKLRLYLNFASSAGEIRTLEYQLCVGVAKASKVDSSKLQGEPIEGSKQIKYRCRGNPLRQMMEVNLSKFPGWQPGNDTAELSLVPEFLARKGLPLFRISNQHDTPQALADLFSFAAYFARLMVSIHLLTFRKPDLPHPAEPKRLPGPLPGLPAPEYFKILVDQFDPEQPRDPANLRLTRYARPGSLNPPVLLIHGYSASGTTFAHPALNPNLASFLWQKNRDVWVLDMRSSCGAPSAKTNFNFEELAYADIPLAVDHVCKHSEAPSIDVVAHCMGAAMFSMAVLSASRVVPGAPYQRQRTLLPGRINRAVFSQVGPLLSLAPANVLRAYVLSYLKYFLPLEDYSFKPTKGGSLADEALDRLLAALPYSDEEFDLENPCIPWRRTPYTTTRHRMDLLYGRTFSLKNLSTKALDHIDDLFGPLSFDTATQVAHFAKYQCITDHGGNNLFVSRKQLRDNWHFPTLSVHGKDNGLADISTLGRMTEILTDAGCKFEQQTFENFGHQDSMIGQSTLPIFEAIERFLCKAEVDEKMPAPSKDPLLVQVPWSGPVMAPIQTSADTLTLPISFGVNPALSNPNLVVVVPLTRTVTGGAKKSRLDVIVNAANAPKLSLYPAPVPECGWIKMTLPLTVQDPPVHSLLLLLVYDEAATLDNAMYGKDAANNHRFHSFEQLNWSDAVLDEDGRGMIDENYKGREDQLAEAIANCLHTGTGGVAPGIVYLPEHTDSEQLNFALGSCQYPPGILDQKTGFDSYASLLKLVRQNDKHAPSPELLLLTGDQIYVDSTAGLFDPTSQDERHVHPYRRWLRTRRVRRILCRVPVYMMLDDHEIKDNWGPIPGDADNHDAQVKGTKHFRNFQRSPHQKRQWQLWHEFNFRGFDFFMADTRTQRSHRTAANVGQQSLLGTGQTEHLQIWLERMHSLPTGERERPKFIVSPAMLFPRECRAQQNGVEASAIHSDGWDGYPASQLNLVKLLKELKLPNLIFLSGDAHLSCIATMTWCDGENSRNFWSVHSSALYAPLPFANKQPEDFIPSEHYPSVVRSAGKSLLKINTEFADPGDGFSYIQVKKDKGNWQVWVSFDRESGVSIPVLLQ